MYTQMGMQIVGGLVSHAQAKEQARMQAVIQKYRNTMAAISAAQNINVSVVNEVANRDAAVRAGIQLDEQAMKDQAASEVGAATAGVSGSSVSLTMRQLERSAVAANEARLHQLKAQNRASNQERRNIRVQEAFQKDIQVIPKPSIGATLLGIGTGVIDVYNSNMPKGSRISDAMAGAYTGNNTLLQSISK